MEALAREQGWRVATRRVDQWPHAATDVFVIDTLGELMPFYACAQVAFVGGSLQAIGGHNLLEPAAMGTAAVTGPHLHNFAEISRRMREAGALLIGEDAQAVGDLLSTCSTMRRRAKTWPRGLHAGQQWPGRAAAHAGPGRAAPAAAAR